MTQEQVLKALMDRRIWNTFRGVISREDFDEELLNIFDTIDKIFTEFGHKDEIKLKDLRIYLPDENIRAVYHQEIPDDEKILIANINQFVTRNRILNILRQCAEDYQKGELNTSQLDAISSGILELQRKLPGKDRGISLTRMDIVEVFRRKGALRKLVTPSELLTKLLDGGPSEGDIMTIVAPTDGGKTMYLINTARVNVELGKKLIYITLQTSLEETLIRFYCSSYNKDYNWMAGNIDKTSKKYLEYIKSVGGEIRFVDGTNRELSVSEIDAIASDFMNELGTGIDGIIIDYGDLLVSSRRYQSPREEMKVVWRELNTLSVKVAAPIVTATQANRAGNIAGTVELIHVAESWSKATDSSVVVAVLRDNADKIRNRATLRIVKTKKTGGYKAVEVLFDPVRCRIE